MTYAAIFERANDGSWGAYVPDLPGVAIVGDTLDEVRAELPALIAFHIEGLREEGGEVPPPTSIAESVTVATA